ncbi:MAG: hypothetical protein M3498_05205 [Deinococcota bacterium]|jgi:2-hydroxychromene-2-carboxylate isomerase|nr:hypothetical protein [Deinococcota bacterium]MDQ3458689.1 hypothetical protein [Deinococcota bacterium]
MTRRLTLTTGIVNLPGVDKQTLVDLTGRTGGIRPGLLRACLKKDMTVQEVEHNTEQAKEIGLRGTPTVVVVGRTYANPDWNDLEGIIVGAL